MYTDYVGMGNFTFQGHLEVKTKMSANVRHENHSFLQATIVNLYVQKVYFTFEGHPRVI